RSGARGDRDERPHRARRRLLRRRGGGSARAREPGRIHVRAHGVLFHEFGHQMGTLRGQVAMPDLYDTTPDEGGYSQGIGAWELMGGGVWNANGFVPAGLSAWTRAWMGFIQPTRVTVDGPQDLVGLEVPGASPRALQIPITQSEYFLIENRRHDPDRNGKF